MCIENKKKSALETEITTLLNQRDKKAIPLLYEHYSAALYGIIFRVIPSEIIAKEVLQDAFLKFWKYADKYDADKGRLFTWLAQVSRNCAIDTKKSKNFTYTKKLNIVHINQLPLDETALKTYPDIKDIGLLKVINSLDNKYYELVDLIYFKGYTHIEAAEELDIPIGTVKTRIRSALLQLRSILEKESIYHNTEFLHRA